MCVEHNFLFFIQLAVAKTEFPMVTNNVCWNCETCDSSGWIQSTSQGLGEKRVLACLQQGWREGYSQTAGRPQIWGWWVAEPWLVTRLEDECKARLIRKKRLPTSYCKLAIQLRVHFLVSLVTTKFINCLPYHCDDQNKSLFKATQTFPKMEVFY